MKMPIFLLVGALVLLAACQDDQVSGPDLRASDSPARGLTAMTWNVYYGTDLNAVVAALANGDPDDDFPAFQTALTTLAMTDWVARAGAIADAIAEHRPHVVGLQEVATYDIDLTAFGGPAFTLPFLTVLQQQLDARGLDYAVADAVQSFVAQPMPGIFMQDENVTLIDVARAERLDGASAQFANGPGSVAPGVAIYDGWARTTVRVGGNAYAIVNTHFTAGEGAELSGLRYLQAEEVLDALSGATPAIVLGDLNDVAGSPMHQLFGAHGFGDVWATVRPGDPGFTCCQQADLMNAASALSQRIDYVLARGMGHPTAGPPATIAILGADPAERIQGTYYPVWPSDHAGLVAAWLTPPARGLR